jgi:glucosamine--fructose-6-phosphate aminotransferase (isomerizing)
MCGIIGIADGLEKEKNCVEEAEEALRRLTYRGYDSWGFSTFKESTKKVGEFSSDSGLKNSGAVVGHTRWATHGKVTEENAHPHTDCEERFHVVHNGTVQNHEYLKENLNGRHKYKSETDTEVIPHFLEHHTQAGRTTAEALHLFDEEAEGNYAVVVLDRKEEQLYGLRRGSPLVFAYPRVEDELLKPAKGAYFASDLYAISDKCDRAYFMEDGDIIMTSGSNLGLMEDGEWAEGFKNENWKEFEWTEEEPELGDDNQYWMEKEIKEIPEALNRLEESLVNEQKEDFLNFKSRIEDDYKKIVFTASGTSYHAALLGAYYFQQQGFNAQALIASEFDNFQHADQETLVIALSQSGETRDVLDAMKSARNSNAGVASIVNVPYSTIQRKSDFSLEIKAQQENCVAATKTFTNQVYTLMNLAGIDVDGISKNVEKAMAQTAFFAFEDATEFHEQGHEDIYIIGNASTYPIAREIALKLKEISYIHAEGMMAGELKHGTLALIEEGTPVITLDDGTGNIESNVEEVEARGARTKKLQKEDSQNENDFVFNATLYGFYLAMYWAHMKDLPVDRPRNLAKSVTVK